MLLPLVILTAVAPASTVCLYDGQLYAQTTIQQEYRDSAWVGRVRLLSARNNWPPNDPNWSGEPWTLYRVQVIERFKGRDTGVLTIFTYRDSGGFYLEPRPQEADSAAEYLLFLNPAPAALPAEARDAMVVHYSCGHSGAWNAVSATDRQILERLRAR